MKRIQAIVLIELALLWTSPIKAQQVSNGAAFPPVAFTQGLLPTPVSSPGGGNFVGTQSATFTNIPSGAAVCYTTDGSAPTAYSPGTCANGTTYSGAFNISSTSTLRAIYTAPYWTNSIPSSETYTISAYTTPAYASYCNGSTSCAWLVVPTQHYAVVGEVWTSSGTLTSVCDGTGTGGCTGSSTYTLNPKYTNSGGGYSDYVFYTCDFAGSTNLTFTWGSGSAAYVAGISISGNTHTGTACNDGYKKGQSTTNNTAFLSGTVTTTNSHDLLVGLSANNLGGTVTAGGDGQSHTYTQRAASGSSVVTVQTLAETANGTYYAAATGPNSKWNMEVMAIK